MTLTGDYLRVLSRKVTGGEINLGPTLGKEKLTADEQAAVLEYLLELADHVDAISGTVQRLRGLGLWVMEPKR